MTVDDLRDALRQHGQLLHAISKKKLAALSAALDVVEAYEDRKSNRDDGAAPPDAEVDAFFALLKPGAYHTPKLQYLGSVRDTTLGTATTGAPDVKGGGQRGP